MLIMMKYGTLQGEATLAGYEGWVELAGLSWSASQGMASGIGAGGKREASAAGIGHVSCSRTLDAFSQHLLREGLAGGPKTVEIHVLVTMRERRALLRSCKLEKAMIASYQTSHAGEGDGRPMESFTLHFQKFETRFVTYDIAGERGPVITTLYDAARAQR